jgi:protein gp37
MLAFAARLRHWPPADYFALNWPRRGELVFAVLCIVALIVVFDVLMVASGRELVPLFQVEAYQSAKEAGWLVWLMLTKRPQLISKLCPFRNDPNIWMGVTAENQYWLDLRWEHLRRVEASIYWLSVEPMFEPLTLPASFLALGSRAWVICGGQSGAGAVSMNPDWARGLRDQCLDSGVRFHMKQMSGTSKAQREAIPGDLMIRERPTRPLYAP